MGTSTRGKWSLDFILKIACLAAVGAGLIWSFLPRTEMSGIKPVMQRDKNMPDFSLPLLTGGEWKLSEHRGNVVLVNFWATWCPPCRAEMPGLARISKELADSHFLIAGIAMDDDGAAAVKPFAASHDIPYPVLLPPADFPMGNAIDSLPTSFLVDRNGRIAKVYIGQISESTLMRDVKLLLSES